MTAITATVQAYFTERLITQRQASPRTIAAYRDTIRMLPAFTNERTRTPCHRLEFTDLDATGITAFLDHLEHGRGNSVRTRNARLPAIHSLFAFAALRHPEHADDISRVLAIPAKRSDHTVITYLTDIEAQALLNAPDQTTRTGRRDHAILQLAIQTGLRASELISLTRNDIHLDTAAHVSCRGKGRKHRITPLTATTVMVLRAWMTEIPTAGEDPLFITNRGGPLSPDALAQRIAVHAGPAAEACPSLADKNVTPHVLPHRRHAPAARRSRHHRHRALAWPRKRHHHKDLPRSRHSNSNNERLTGPPPQPRPRAVTGHPTSSWRSSKPSEIMPTSTLPAPLRPAETSRISA